MDLLGKISDSISSSLSKSRSKSKSSSSKSKTRSKSNSKSSSSDENVSIQLGSPALKLPEPLPQKREYTEKINTHITRIIQKNDKIKEFLGFYLLENLFYLYLFSKYKMNCLIKAREDPNNSEIGLIVKIFAHRNNIQKLKDDYLIQISPLLNFYSEQIVNCIINGSNIIIIPMDITLIYSDNTTDGHANLLIYRRNRNELEHFEPHGKVLRDTNFMLELIIGNQIREYLTLLETKINVRISEYNESTTKSNKLERVKLISAHSICPESDGFQILEGRSKLPLPVNILFETGGYCSAWSMFFTELCLKNPEIPSREIYRFVLNNPKITGNKSDYFKRVIYGYTYYINNKIVKHFSDIFEEKLTTTKIIKRIKNFKNKEEENTVDTKIYYNKFKNLLKSEFEKQPIDSIKQPWIHNVVSKYRSMKSGLNSNTSSSVSSKKTTSSKKTSSSDDPLLTEELKEDLRKTVKDYLLQKKIKETMLLKKGPEIAKLKQRIKDTLKDKIKPKTKTKKKKSS